MDALLPAIASVPETFVVSGVVAAVNSCSACWGNRACIECKGARFLPTYDHKATGAMRACPSCRGSGRCLACQFHCEVLSSFAKDLERGELGAAQATLQRALMSTDHDDFGVKTNIGIGAAGVGMVLGTLLAPGMGTVVGLSLGKMLGDKVAGGMDVGMVAWKQADLLYSLGVVLAAQGRKQEADQAWIKAVTLHPQHETARAALRDAQ